MIDSETLRTDLELAHALADEARTISLALFRGAFGQRRKADGSIVTDADEAVERALRARIARERPGDAVLGEEFGETGDGPRRWIIDAIDGTASFAVGSDYWGTLIALESDGQLVVGICDMAPKDRRYWAARGQGAFRQERGGEATQLAVSSNAHLQQAPCFVPSADWIPVDDRQRGAVLSERSVAADAHDHPALLVATGELDIAVFFAAGAWDVAAPAIVVAEAGGQFSDLYGGSSLARSGALFSNGRLHDATLELVRRPAPSLP
jgi:histidinol-phosphatase